MDFKTTEIKLAHENDHQQKKNWRLVMFGRRLFVLLALLVQFAVSFLLSWNGAHVFAWVSMGFTVVGILLSLFIIQKKDSSGFKLLWVFFVLAAPIFGVTFYFVIRGQSSTKRMRKISGTISCQYHRAITQIAEDIEEIPLGSYDRIASYLKDHGGFLPCTGGKNTYYPSGEEMFGAMLEDLEKAERYIFLEYFIVNEGVLFSRIYDVLCRKAAQGVEVRLMMDDMGCFLLRPRHFARDMEEKGIKVHVFNPFRPIVTVLQNNRDHRKIAVIDGKVSYTGGVNIADEYVNLHSRFGYWKDTAVRMEGTVARQWAAIFLALWNTSSLTVEEWDRYIEAPEGEVSAAACGGTVIPYSFYPHTKEPICRNLYLHMIQNARKSLYICTPYLMPDESLLDALILAARSGVDVRIVIPYHADKKLVKMAGKTYFSDLIRAGVRIYEYTPGFNHGKMVLADGVYASVGSANLDYRSLYLHYECGALFIGGDVATGLARDFDTIFADSAEVPMPRHRLNYLHTVWDQLLRLLAPLM